ncbi:MAG: GNAT family N-acetyltransferase [Candidatus Thermoplasmatota archaeon]|nr:GNAT family N-acetyltransferase [Candidatus Thermoplasmatota archaeon]MBU4070797.1 GNAT family N-acetyltransferase [Candidatus Thermoplasmatota archaeon]MBU4144799.1 GNAT family N-acetyltransferase [Candidatus Thermoplasmatota archaeon]
MSFQPFQTDTKNILGFDCGNKELNDFLCTEEVRKFNEEHLGRTTLVFYSGELVAYYTLSNSSLRKEYLQSYKSFSKMGEFKLEEFPSITIGRLAVDKRWQGKGIGRVIMQKIMVQALNSSESAGVRLLLVQAKQDAFDFYLKLGFEFVFDSKRERSRFKARGTRTLFFDIASLSE